MSTTSIATRKRPTMASLAEKIIEEARRCCECEGQIATREQETWNGSRFFCDRCDPDSEESSPYEEGQHAKLVEIFYSKPAKKARKK